MGLEKHRQVGGVQHFARDHRGEGDLGGGDRPQIITLEVIGVVSKLGEMAGANHRLGFDNRRRPYFFEGVAIAV